jgi:hypothetical protein
MNLSFLPGNLHLTKNTNGIFVLTMRGEEILSTKSQRSALAKFNAIRSELEMKLPVHELTAEKKPNFFIGNLQFSFLGAQ